MKRAKKSLGDGVKKNREKRKYEKQRAKRFADYQNKPKDNSPYIIPFKGLLSILHDLKKHLGVSFNNSYDAGYAHADGGMLKDDYLDVECYENIYQIITVDFNTFLSNADNRSIKKILKLKTGTKRHLKSLIPNLDETIHDAKKSLPISDTAKTQDDQRLLELIREKLNTEQSFCFSIFPEYTDDEISDEHIWNEFFGEYNHPYGNDYRFKRIKNYAIKELQEELKIRITYLENFKEKRATGYPKKWMTNNKKIRFNMNKKGNRFFYSLFNYLTENRIKPKDNKTDRINSVLVHCNREYISKKLGMNKQTLHNYLKEMDKWEIINKKSFRD